MPRRRSFTAVLLAACFAASMLAPGARAATPDPSIKRVKVYSNGFDGGLGLCNFNAVVTYRHKLAASDELFFVLRRDGENINSNLEFLGVTSGAPLTIGLSTGSLLATSSYDFIVELGASLSPPLSSATTSAFSYAGCPPAGTLVASYPVK